MQCPQPLAALLVERYAAAGRPVAEAILEVLLRRFYRIRALDEIRVESVDGHPFAVASYEREGRTRHALLAHAGDAGLAATLAAWAASRPPPRRAGSPWATSSSGGPRAPARPRRTPPRLRAVLAGVALPRAFRRIVIVVGGAGAACSTSPSVPAAGGGYAEEAFFRDAHPMMAKRLQLCRLQHFDLERLPSVEDVYLFRAVAKGNPRDERLFAVAEVRDLTPVRDGAGRVVQLPELERMLLEALGAIRRRADAPAGGPAPARQPRDPARLAGPRRVRRGPPRVRRPATRPPPRAWAWRG